jgi:hypothetical protein
MGSTTLAMGSTTLAMGSTTLAMGSTTLAMGSTALAMGSTALAMGSTTLAMGLNPSDLRVRERGEWDRKPGRREDLGMGSDVVIGEGYQARPAGTLAVGELPGFPPSCEFSFREVLSQRAVSRSSL